MPNQQATAVPRQLECVGGHPGHECAHVLSVLGGTTAAVLLATGTAYATSVSFSGSGNKTSQIPSNTSTHCLSYLANVSYGWDDGTFWIIDFDTKVTVKTIYVPKLGANATGKVCGLYGKHYYMTGYSTGPIHGTISNSSRRMEGGWVGQYEHANPRRGTRTPVGHGTGRGVHIRGPPDGSLHQVGDDVT